MSSAILSPPPSFRTATGGSRVTVCWSRDFYSEWLWWMEGTNSTRPDKQWIALQENNTNKIRLETHRSTPQTVSEVGITGEVGRNRDGCGVYVIMPFEQNSYCQWISFRLLRQGFFWLWSRTWSEDSLETRIVYGMWLLCGCSPLSQVT